MTQTDGEALAPGAAIRAVFPRMAGKRRPGLVAALAGAGVVAMPLTTRRTWQPGRRSLSEAERAALGLDKRKSQVLLDRAAYLPAARIEAVTGVAPPALKAELEEALLRWYGADWRIRDPALRAPGPARLLHPR